jgi:hypothetical protein
MEAGCGVAVQPPLQDSKWRADRLVSFRTAFGNSWGSERRPTGKAALSRSRLGLTATTGEK